jgi:hypothetical protein
MKRWLFLLVATLWLWPLREAASQQLQHDQFISGWDALLDQLPFFLIIVLLVVVAWSLVLLVLYTLLPFSVFGLNAKLDRINRSLQSLSREIVGMAREGREAHQAAYGLSQEEEQRTAD